MSEIDDNFQIHLVINANKYCIKSVLFQLLNEFSKIETQKHHKKTFKVIIFIFFKLKKIEIRYYIIEKKMFIMIKYIIKTKYLIIKYKYFTILYTNHQILEFIILIEIDIHNQITR